MFEKSTKSTGADQVDADTIALGGVVTF